MQIIERKVTMTVRSRDFVGIAEGIKSHELSTKGKIESLIGTISELSGRKNSLDNQISYLEVALSAAYEDTDEDGNPDYGRISAIESQINVMENELSSVEQELDSAQGELDQSEAELESVMEEKAQTLFEIQERARKTSQNISLAGGMYGAYSGVGGSLQDSLQTSLFSLSRAASMLDGSVDVVAGKNASNSGSSSSGSNFANEDLSTGALSAFVDEANHFDANFSESGIDMSSISDYTTEHNGAVTPAIAPNFHTSQKLMSSQKTLNFTSIQNSNNYVLSMFSDDVIEASVVENSMYNSSQQSSGMESRFDSNNSFMAGLKSAVVSDEEAVVNRSNASGTSTNSTNNDVNITIIQRDIPTYNDNDLEHADFINKIRQKMGYSYKGAKDEFVEIANDNIPNYINSDIKSELRDMVNDGLPINPPYTYESSSDNNDDVMSDEPNFLGEGGKTRDEDEDKVKERMGGFGHVLNSSYDISKVKGITLKVGNKNAYKIEVVKDRFIPQKDIKPLWETRQPIRLIQYTEDGSKARIFDHPEKLSHELPYKQGNNERGMKGTCGLANLAVWLKIAGSSYKEKDVVNCAATNLYKDGNFLCSEEGGTIVEWRQHLWGMFGMDANVYERGTMPDDVLIDKIAAAVENGRAVSVGLNAGQLWSKNNLEDYDYSAGKDNAFGDGGSNHVVGIVSCERDFDTGEITHLYINDTGRELERDACRKVPIEDFKKAFCVERASVCMSQYAIW